MSRAVYNVIRLSAEGVKRKSRAAFARGKKVAGKRKSAGVLPHDAFALSCVRPDHGVHTTRSVKPDRLNRCQTLSSRPFTPDIDAHDAQQ